MLTFVSGPKKELEEEKTFKSTVLIDRRLSMDYFRIHLGNLRQGNEISVGRTASYLLVVRCCPASGAASFHTTGGFVMTRSQTSSLEELTLVDTKLWCEVDFLVVSLLVLYFKKSECLRRWRAGHAFAR